MVRNKKRVYEIKQMGFKIIKAIKVKEKKILKNIKNLTMLI